MIKLLAIIAFGFFFAQINLQDTSNTTQGPPVGHEFQDNNLPPESPAITASIDAIDNANFKRLRYLIAVLPPFEQDIIAQCYKENTDTQRPIDYNCYLAKFETVKASFGNGVSDRMTNSSKWVKQGMACLTSVASNVTDPLKDVNSSVITENVSPTLALQAMFNQCQANFIKFLSNLMFARRRFLVMTYSQLFSNCIQDSYGYVINCPCFVEDIPPTVTAFKDFAQCANSFYSSLSTSVVNTQAIIAQLDKCKPPNSTPNESRNYTYNNNTIFPENIIASLNTQLSAKTTGSWNNVTQKFLYHLAANTSDMHMPMLHRIVIDILYDRKEIIKKEFNKVITGETCSNDYLVECASRTCSCSGTCPTEFGKPISIRWLLTPGSSTNGTQPPPTNGTQPPPTNGTQPPPTNGTQPPPTNGTQPPPTNGTQPPPTNGTQPPPPTNGTQPPPTNGTQPPPTNGTQPPPTNGTYPNGTYPQPTNGTYPNGTYPPPKNGTYPNGTYPNYTYPNGTYPNYTYPNGTYPNYTYPNYTYPQQNDTHHPPPNGTLKAGNLSITDDYLAEFCLNGKRYLYSEANVSDRMSVDFISGEGKEQGSTVANQSRACNKAFSGGDEIEKQNCTGPMVSECKKLLDGTCTKSGLYKILGNNPPNLSPYPPECDDKVSGYSDEKCFKWIMIKFTKGTLIPDHRNICNVQTVVQDSTNATTLLRFLEASIEQSTVTVQQTDFTLSDPQCVKIKAASTMSDSSISIDSSTATKIADANAYIAELNTIAESTQATTSSSFVSLSGIAVCVIIALLV